MKSLETILILVFALVVTSCNDLKKFEDGINAGMSTEDVYKKYPDLQPLWEKQNNESLLWTRFILLELEKTPDKFLYTQPTDLKTFCPKYGALNEDERKYFWAFLISLMVKFESGFDPEAKYEEDFEDSAGIPVVSRGLLQISFESSQSYNCGFANAEAIHDPYQNLSCGLKILSKWIPADQSIAGYMNNNWRGGARYWSVLRAGDKESYKTIVERTSQLKLCK